MKFDATIRLGDLMVALTVAFSIVTCYFALIGVIKAFRARLGDFAKRQGVHGSTLKIHTQYLQVHGKQLAGLEGHIFQGRRSGDTLPPLPVHIE